MHVFTSPVRDLSRARVIDLLILDLPIVTSYLELDSIFSRKYGSFASVVTLSTALVSSS